jgi:hypothetical protein
LPDGTFSNQKSKFWSILEGLAMEDVGIIYGHLIFFVAIEYFYIYLEHFPVLVCCIKKNLATLKLVAEACRIRRGALSCRFAETNLTIV